MKKERKVWAIILIALGWLAPNPSNAQQDSVKTTHLGDVVITAAKFPKNVNETAKELTVIDETQLARSAGKDVSQLLNEQVGLVINGANSNPGKDKAVFLRGAGTGYTLIVIDGIPVNDPSGVGGAFDLRLLPVDQIERIEILKGSQSTLYGTDAIAGVINIITKKKGDKPLGGFATIGYGSYNTLKGNVGLSGSTKIVDYNIGYTRYTTDGISEAKDPAGSGDYDKDGYNQDAFQASVDVRISGKFSLKPYFRYNNFDGKYDGGAFTDSRKNNYTSNLLNTGLSGSYKLTKGAVNVLYGYDKTDRNFDDDYGLFSYKGRFHHIEGFIHYNLSPYVQFLAGTSYQNITMLDEFSTGKNPTVTILSPYASFFLKSGTGLNVELGGRLNNHSQYGSNFTYSFNPSYLINERIKIYANVSSGFKVPTLSQLYGSFGSNPSLTPEKSQNYEGGVQFFANKNFDIRVSAFQRTITDVIVSITRPDFTSTYVNLNKQSDHGYEAEASAKLSPAFSLQAFYAYVDGHVTDNRSGTATTYENLIRRPRHSIGLKLGYQASPKLFVQLNLKTFSNRTDLYFNTATFVTESVSLDAYALLDFYGEYKLWKDNIRLYADMKNLLNQDYMEVYGYNTLKFNVMTGLNIRF